MTSSSAVALVPRHRLRTFGTLALAIAENEQLDSPPSRRSLALLAVLAAAAERGRSRDELLLLFWPDASQSQARHSLEQLVYEVRRTIDKRVFVGVNPLRLNSEVISSDIADFSSALERGEYESSVRHYRGQFLDGFYLSDAPEFERWASSERAQLQRQFVGALELLAQRATDANDRVASVQWWRRLTETDPLSTTNAAGLIRALVDAGDHAAALQHAERYEAVVSRELGTTAGPAIAALVAEVREKAAAAPSAASMKMPRGGSRIDAALPVASGASADAPQLTPSIDQRSVEAPVSAAVSSRRRARYSSPALFGFAVLMAALAAGWFLRSPRKAPSPAGDRPSIAVLPLKNVGDTPENVPFVDGLTEEVTGSLAKIRNLRVIARTSAFAFKNSRLDIRQIGESLGVSTILEGSVQKSADHIRVQVRLADVRDGSTRWSETYDRELKDRVIFAVQSDIASSVARALDLELGEATLGVIRRGSTANVAAHELYLRGNDPALTRSDTAASTGLEYFRQAIALDPKYAAAYAGFARLRLRSPFVGKRRAPFNERLPIADKAAETAVALDDSLADAHASLGLIRKNEYRMAAAETELRRAVTLEPSNARFREWLSQLYVLSDRPDEALIESRKAVELDPLSPTATAELARALLANDRCDEALAQLKKLTSLKPPLQRARNLRVHCYLRKGRWSEAMAELSSGPGVTSSRDSGLVGYILARSQRTDDARRILASLLNSSNKNSFDVATVYAGLGENDEAFAWLDKAVDDHSVELDGAPIQETLRSDPRFARFRRRIGFAQR